MRRRQEPAAGPRLQPAPEEQTARFAALPSRGPGGVSLLIDCTRLGVIPLQIAPSATIDSKWNPANRFCCANKQVPAYSEGGGSLEMEPGLRGSEAMIVICRWGAN